MNEQPTAFPVPYNYIDRFGTGLTLRDYFAAHAPEPYKEWRGGNRGMMDIIEWRWFYADAMITARNK